MSDHSSTIEALKQQLDEAEQFLEESRAKHAENPNSFTNQATLNSWSAHVEELKDQIREAKEELGKEVFLLRLFSGQMNGSIPLRLLVKMTQSLNGALEQGAYFLRYGQSPTRGVPQSMAEELDLRFSDLSYGSSRITFSGKISPDTAGDSLLEMTLSHIFDALAQDSEEHVQDLVATIGVRSIKELLSFLKNFESEEVGAELAWPSPEGRYYRWGGTLTEVKAAKARLQKLSDIKPEKITVTGQVFELKVTGSFKIIPYDEDIPIKISYQKDQQRFVDSLHLHQEITVRLMKFGRKDEVSGEERYAYRLVTEEDETSKDRD